MFNARNQVRWFEEEWRRNNEREVEEVENIEKPVLEVVAKVSESVRGLPLSEEEEEAAKIAENLAKHVEKLRKYFGGTTESKTMEIPVHRQKATR